MTWGELRQRRPRERNSAYMGWIAKSPCVACLAEGRGARFGVQVCHIRSGSLEYDKRPTGAGERPSDKPWTVGMCEPHHRKQHTMNEMAFWSAVGIDVFALCKDLEAAYDAGSTPAPIIARHAGYAQRERERRAGECP